MRICFKLFISVFLFLQINYILCSKQLFSYHISMPFFCTQVLKLIFRNKRLMDITNTAAIQQWVKLDNNAKGIMSLNKTNKFYLLQRHTKVFTITTIVFQHYRAYTQFTKIKKIYPQSCNIKILFLFFHLNLFNYSVTI